MRQPIEDVRRLGGLAKFAELSHAGHARSQVRRALGAGELLHIRSGWYGDPLLSPEVVRAARIGGRLDCSSAAEHFGLWIPDNSLLHVAVTENASRLRTSTNYRDRRANHPEAGTSVHWYSREQPGSRQAVSPASAVAHSYACLGARDAFVVHESALRRLGWTALEEFAILEMVRVEDKPLARLAGRTSDSGTESILKFELLRLGIPFRQQIAFPGTGPVDFLIGEALVIELDSREHHSEPYRDRHKDAVLSSHGCRVLRFMYSQILFEWPSVERAILAALARGDAIR